MQTKLSQVQAALARDDVVGALRIAARFPDLGTERAAILDAWTAVQSPRFLQQLGKDPAAVIAAGQAALVRRYPLR